MIILSSSPFRTLSLNDNYKNNDMMIEQRNNQDNNEKDDDNHNKGNL